MQKISGWLSKPKAPHGIALFRILFGLLLLWDIQRFYSIDLIENYFSEPAIFYYDFLHVHAASKEVMDLLLAGLTISAICITIGLFYRIAIAFFAIVFSYFFLLDQVIYNNHLYAICLIAFMLFFMRADGALSVRKKRHVPFVPQWNYRLLQFQIVVIYFFGGISKLNPYWLDMHPVQELLAIRAERSDLAFLNEAFFHYIVAYTGVFFDLCIGFFLLIKKTRIAAVVAAVIFNLTNSWIFDDIYIFPFFMIAALLLFLDPEKIKARLQSWNIVKDSKTGAKKAKAQVQNTVTPISTFGTCIILLYVLVQLALPLRHYFVTGYTDWTGEYQRFSWRMKIQNREINEVKFAIFDLDKKEIHKVDIDNYLYPDEILQMCYSPRMITQFAYYLKEEVARRNGIRRCWVKCKINVSFNGLPAVDIFDPDTDLIEGYEIHDSFNEWINPLPVKKKEILR